ncbi:MAG: quinone oxidoreductase [Pseudomonadota bacterium]|nr:quinone oxidoreductase [Pseudomonadota bacterium]
MRAIRIHSPGGPEVMQLEDVELPAPGPGQSSVRHHAIGVNYLDIYFRTGQYPSPLPFTPGSEGSGEVTAVGPGVDGFKVGDRVAYVTTPGSYAQARNVDVKHLVKLPDNVSHEQAAAMMLKGLTAQYLLRQTYRVQPGDTILVHAAAGGVGQILCQWGKHLGAMVIGTVGSPAKAEIARGCGADHVINYSTEDFAARVAEITKGGKCAVVYDGVGKATFPASLDCLRPFGVFASFGSASGPVEAFNLGLLGQKGSLFATRPTLFTFLADRARLETMAKELFEVVGSGVVKVDISDRAPLADVARVHRDLEGRRTTASIVLIP